MQSQVCGDPPRVNIRYSKVVRQTSVFPSNSKARPSDFPFDMILQRCMHAHYIINLSRLCQVCGAQTRTMNKRKRFLVTLSLSMTSGSKLLLSIKNKKRENTDERDQFVCSFYSTKPRGPHVITTREKKPSICVAPTQCRMSSQECMPTPPIEKGDVSLLFLPA